MTGTRQGRNSAIGCACGQRRRVPRNVPAIVVAPLSLWKWLLFIPLLTYFDRAVEKWLTKPSRRPQHTLGLGIDCSDSLLYEGVTMHARRYIPLFADGRANPAGCKLVLLTKSANVDYLKDLPARNSVIAFSLNPERVADLWEGKYEDGVRITPSIATRLAAARRAQEWGFEIRFRVDPSIMSCCAPRVMKMAKLCGIDVRIGWE